MSFIKSRERATLDVQRLIFLLASREPRELATYMRVAVRVKEWLEPLLYKTVSISSKASAASLLRSLAGRSKTVLYLRIGRSVPPGTVAKLLGRCSCLINLALQGENSFYAILNTFNNLKNLKYLSVDPALFFQTGFVHLPDVSTFHRVTHLDLVTESVWKTVTTGFQYLRCLTHLSMPWKICGTATHSLLDVLRHQRSKLILLWLGAVDDEAKVVRKLRQWKLDHPKVVMLHLEHKEASGRSWLHAEHIITWRKVNNIDTVERPTMSEVATFAYKCDHQSLPWE